MSAPINGAHGVRKSVVADSYTGLKRPSAEAWSASGNPALWRGPFFDVNNYGQPTSLDASNWKLDIGGTDAQLSESKRSVFETLSPLATPS